MLVKVLYKILKKVVDNCDKFYLEETDPDVMEAKELLGRMKKSDERGWRKKMTIDEAVKHAKEVAGDSRCTECAKEIAKQLASWLEELKELREKSKWIPCSERMPAEQTDVLVTVKYSGFMGMHGTWIKTGHLEHYGWDGDCCGGTVIAWMPLPEPYKGE